MRLGLLCFFVSCQLGAATLPPDLTGKIFLGEAYPSGNVYLQAFVGTILVDWASGALELKASELKELSRWPVSVTLQPIHGQAAKDAAVKAAHGLAERRERVKNVLSTKPVKNGISIETDEYLPAKEGMDTNHESCGLPYKINPKLKYADESDFFETVLDYCSMDDNVVHYRISGAASAKAYAVLALAKGLELDSVDYPKNRKRPLSAAEAAGLKRIKAAAKPDEDATTVPQYFDSAEVLLEGAIKGQPFRLRISTYQDAGAGGHLSHVYIADVVEKDHVVGTYVLTHYFGPI
jgi:hypothetical protein